MHSGATMTNFRIPMFATAVVVMFTGSLAGSDLSRYREYSFEMNLPAVASQTKVSVSESTTVHQRPALLQDLRWRLERVSGSSDTRDPVNEILFSFYNGQLFRMVALYDRQKTRGLKTADVIEPISATYGVATTPTADIILPSRYKERYKVLARWEDSDYAFSLVRSPYDETFELVGISKRLNTLAEAASLKAAQLDDQEAPQRKKNEDEATRVEFERTRTINKASFRP
jgi:hypothetical protein